MACFRCLHCLFLEYGVGLGYLKRPLVIPCGPGHGQVSERLFNRIRSECSEAELRSRNQSAACRSLLEQMGEGIGGYYAYGLYDE